MEPIETLSKFPLISTDQIEVAEVVISRSLSDVKILSAQNLDQFHLKMNGVNIGKSSLVYNRYNSYTKIALERPLKSVSVVFGGKEQSKFKLGKRSVTVSQQRAALIMPGEKMQIERCKGSEILVLKVELPDLLHHFENLTNRHNPDSLSFDNSIDLKTEAGAMLSRMVRYVSFEINHNNRFLQNSGLSKSFEQILLSAILFLPHKHRNQLLEERQYHVEPSLVRKAEEYMRAHLGDAISILDLLQECGCSRSVLYAAFKNARGYSPMRFLTEQRLQCAREKLIGFSAKRSVSHIAGDCGFNDLSRFAKAYRNRFGELPSETLRTKR